MRILIVTPLYPPDTAETAQYVKELAKRLSDQHKVTVVLYGHLPEELSNVETCCVDKRKPIVMRLFSFFKTLLRELRKHDMLYIINGRSVEVPVFFATKLRRIPHVFLPFDTTAPLTSFGRTLQQTSSKDISYANLSLIRPEVLPFEEYPAEAFKRYEEDWKKHLESLV
ncbi:hypothetical protein KTR10_00080 [Candidatus Kaiserbacteria bacterium]|nr:hypothetical protein [Candidatus Kaiserbacteria bacterium]